MSEEIFLEYIHNYDQAFNNALYSKDDLIDFIDSSLHKNKNFSIDQSLNFDPELLKFYTVIKKWKFFWKTKEDCKIEQEGTFNILPIATVLIGDVDFLPEEFPVMKNFTLLDHFYNEGAVGFYLDKPEEGLFYFEFDADPQKLNLNFKGYLEMLKYTMGAGYWQNIILEPDGGISERIIDNMHQLFPEFTREGFFELYNSVRIDK